MNSLTFTQHISGTYRATIASTPESRAVTVQLKRKSPGYVRVLASIDNAFEPVRIALIGVHNVDFIQQLEQPAGTILTIESETPVTLGGYV